MKKPAILPPIVLDALNEAMRIAARRDGAPRRCQKKACRRSGRCHAELDEHGCPACAGGMSARAEASAVDMLVFLYAWRRKAELAATPIPSPGSRGEGGPKGRVRGSAYA
ncbi:MAG: hypothetical protein JJ913_15600 [Rhizobiaceae bacterium]|nr:hypothetical protein [Rhizobiaceae bacterium]